MSTAYAKPRLADVLRGGRKAASYERISRFRVQLGDNDVAVSRGVTRQREDAEKAAELYGLGALTPYRDDNSSASRFRTKERQHWLRLLADIRSGQLGLVLVWVLDRIIRDPDDLSALLAACREAGALILQTGSGTVVDASDPDSVMVARIQGAVAEAEAAKTSMRVRRAQLDNRKAGKPHGGTRCFGYLDAAYSAEHPTEADAVRTVVGKVLGGASLRSQAMWLNDKGLLGVRGASWTGGNLGLYLVRPALAGLRVHRPATGDVEVYPAAWDGLITEGQHEQIKGLLGDPERRTNAACNNVRTVRFSTVVRCGVCGSGLRNAPYRSRSKHNKGQRLVNYRCASGCVSRSVEQVDEQVLATCAAYLERLRPEGLLRSPDQEAELGKLAARATQLNARIKQARADYEADLIDGALYKSKADKAKTELQQVAAAKAELVQAHTVLADVAGQADARALLDAMPWDRLRTIVSHLAVVYLDQSPHYRGPHAGFTPELVRFDWQVG